MRTANENEEEDQTPGWLQLLLFPCLLVAYIRQLFADQAERTRARRRSHGLPTNWRGHIDDLRESEQLIAAIKAEGARRILAGEPLDLDHLSIIAPDPEQWIAPTSAQQMHLRMLGLSRFHADPERFIYRHALRVLRAAARTAATTTATIRVRNVRPARRLPTTTTITTAASARAGMRVRAPPWRAQLPISVRFCHGSPASGIVRVRSKWAGPARPELPKVYPQEPVAVAFIRQIGVTTNPTKVLPIGRHVLCDSFDAGPAR